MSTLAWLALGTAWGASLYIWGRREYFQGLERGVQAANEYQDAPALLIRRWPLPVVPKERLN